MNESFFRLFLLGVGAAAAVTDWRERRIPNRLIGFALFLAAVGVGLQLAGSALGHRGVRLMDLGEYYMPWGWYPKLAVHAALSVTAAWTLWRLDVWPAGDAKLFIALAALLPLANANLTGFPLLLFLAFLVNVFVPAGLLFAGEGVSRMLGAFRSSTRRGWWLAVKAVGEVALIRIGEFLALRWQAAALVTNLLALFFCLRFAEAYLHRQPIGPFGHLLVFLAMFVAWTRISPLLRAPRIALAALALVLCGCAFAAWEGLDLALLLWRTAQSTLNFSFFISIARGPFESYLEGLSRSSLMPDEIREGVILSEEAWASLQADPEAAALLEDRRCDGLTEKEAEGLKAYLKARQRTELRVYRSVPFAVWIFLGACLTLFKRGTVISWMAPWAEKGVRLLTASGGGA